MTNLDRPVARALRQTSLLLRANHLPPAVDTQRDVASVVSWFGAMQGQDLASAQWSLGVRLPGFSLADVEAALERREALRTWPMRGTIHLVPPRDAHWMLATLGARPLAGAAARREHLGLTEQVADRAVEVLAQALAGGRRLTRAQCVEALTEAGIDAVGQRAYHLLWFASQRGVTCIGPNLGKEQTFVLLDEWVTDPVRLDRDEALATLALRYFRSHGPASVPDFAGWTGLTMADARRGVAGCDGALTTVRVDGRDLLVSAELLDAEPPAPLSADDVVALPGFDEFLLGVKDRSLVLDPEHLSAVIPGRNGVFRSTVVRTGRVVATWKRTLTAKRVTVEVWPLDRLAAADRKRTERALTPYARFLDRSLEVRWP